MRINLSVGLPTWAKAFATVVLLGVATVGVLFTVVTRGLSDNADSFDRDFPRGEPVPDLFSIVPKVMSFCGLPFVLFALYMLVRVWRTAAWLDGTVVSKRGAFLTKSVDLATADVSMGAINYRQGGNGHGNGTIVRVPALSIASAGIKIPLRGQGLDLLPANELTALASALESNTSASAERVRAIGAHLRSLAADPLAY